MNTSFAKVERRIMNNEGCNYPKYLYDAMQIRELNSWIKWKSQSQNKPIEAFKEDDIMLCIHEIEEAIQSEEKNEVSENIKLKNSNTLNQLEQYKTIYSKV